MKAKFREKHTVIALHHEIRTQLNYNKIKNLKKNSQILDKEVRIQKQTIDDWACGVYSYS